MTSTAWGGEEFLLMFAPRNPDALVSDVRALLHRIHAISLPWNGTHLSIAVSGGLILQPLAPKDTLSEGLRWTDAALYLAKRSGRDQVIHLQAIDETQLVGTPPHAVTADAIERLVTEGVLRMDVITA